MPRYTNQTVTALRAALLCDLPWLRRAVESEIRNAVYAAEQERSPIAHCSERLRIPRRALERLRELRPDLFSR